MFMRPFGLLADCRSKSAGQSSESQRSAASDSWPAHFPEAPNTSPLSNYGSK